MKSLFLCLALVVVMSVCAQPAQASIIVHKSSALGLSKGLVGHWTFDGKDMAGSRAFDASGQGNYGTVAQLDLVEFDFDPITPSHTVGKIGQALDFNGSNITIHAGNGSSLRFERTDKFSGAAWIKLDSFIDGDWRTIFGKMDDTAGGNSRGYHFSVASDGTLQLYLISNINTTNFSTANSSGTTLQRNTWYHVAFTYSGSGSASGAKFYINGQPQTTVLGTNSLSDTINHNEPFEMGSRDGTGQTFDGIIDDVRIYNRELSKDEIKRLYKIGATLKVNTTISTDSLTKGLVGHWTFDGKDMAGVHAYDASGNNNRGTLNGTYRPAMGRIGQGLSFEGSDDDYVEISDHASLEPGRDVTMALWVYPTAYDTADDAGLIFKRGNQYGCCFQPAYGLGMLSGTGNIVVSFADATDYANDQTSINVPRHTWSHLVALRNDSVYRIYLNGAEVKSGTLTLGNLVDTSQPLRLNLGDGGWGSGSINGTLDDVRIYNRALSADEIKRLYKIGATLKVNTTISNDSLTKGLVGHWTFDGKDMAQSYVFDKSGNDNRGKMNVTTATQTFSTTASTTFAIPPGVSTMTIETWGAGGGGGFGLASSDGGGGGGGGGYAKSVLSVNGGQTYTLSIGDGGNGVTSAKGTPGGDSYVVLNGSVIVLACGGGGGGASADNGNLGGLAGAGGTTACATGQVEFAGGAGAAGENGSDGDGGGGGESACTTGTGNDGSAPGTNGGAGGTGCDGGDGGTGGNNGANGSPGSGPGGGGGGSGEGTVAGGAGADGQIKLTYDIPGPTRTAGKLGQAMSFDGVDDYVEIPSNSIFDVSATQSLTLSAWIKTSSTAGQLIMERFNTTGPTTAYYRLTMNEDCSTGTVGFNIRSSSGGETYTCTTATFNDNQWHHVVGVRNVASDSLQIFVDGVLHNSQTDPTTSNLANENPLWIGVHAQASPINEYFNGTIDDVRIYNRALSLDEIKRLYNLGR